MVVAAGMPLLPSFSLTIGGRDILVPMGSRAGGADACCIETFAAIDEAVLAVHAARENTGLEVLCTFTFEKTVHGDYRTMMGVSPTEMAGALLEAGADVIGSNCGNGAEDMVAVARVMKTLTELPIIIQPNAGMPTTRDGELVYPESPQFMAERARDMISLGVSIIGGCCGTTPEHVKAIREAVDSTRL